MNNNFIISKSFLFNASAFIALTLAGAALSSCGDNPGANVIVSQKDEYDAMLDSKETFTIQEFQKATGGKLLAKLPAAVLAPCGEEPGRNLALKKMFIDGKAYMHIIPVTVVESGEYYKLTEGLSKGDILYVNPYAVMREMAKINIKETKKRFSAVRFLIPERSRY